MIRVELPAHLRTQARVDGEVKLISEVLMTPSQQLKHKGSILVIDDESASLRLLFTLLTEDGYTVHERQLDLKSDLRFVKGTLPDLVLVDVRKPGTDGYQVCASLKNDPTTRAIPVMFISSIDRSLNQAKALLSGAVDYVTDPFDAEEVLWRIETHISLRRLRDNLISAACNHGAQPVARSEDLERAFQEIHALTQVTGRKHAEEKVRQAARELKKAEEALRASERNACLMVDSIPGLIALLTATGEVEVVSRQVFEYFGQTLQELRQWATSDIVHPEDLPHLIDAFRRSIASGSSYDIVQRLRRSDGVYRWFRNCGSPFRDANGHTVRWYVLLTDIDDRKRAEEALNRARSELTHVARITTLNALTASIAHEVNQPLSGIITNASTCLRMLNGDPPNVEGARETARRIIRDGNRASDVITRLRALFSKKEFTLEPLDLNEATQEVIALSLSDLQRNRVILRSELAEGLPSVIGDRVQLQQVILNLLRNASDAMNTIEDHPRELLIKTERGEEDRVRLSVKDVGVGFRPEVADKLFEAFYTTKPDGMGIGLSVSRSIIEVHHGCLWVTANDGPGVTFSFSIPYKAGNAEARVNPTASEPGAGKIPM